MLVQEGMTTVVACTNAESAVWSQGIKAPDSLGDLSYPFLGPFTAAKQVSQLAGLRGEADQASFRRWAAQAARFIPAPASRGCTIA